MKGNIKTTRKPGDLRGIWAKALASLFAAGLFLAVLAGCQNPTQPHNVAETEPGPAMGKLALTINEGIQRTIRPDDMGADDFDYFTLRIRAAGNHAETHDLVWDGEGYVGIYAGVWDMRVTAHIGGGIAAESGWYYDISVTAGETISRSIMLAPILVGDGQGTFSWDVGFPAGATRAGMTLTPLGATVGAIRNYYFRGGTPELPATGSLELDVGQYRVVFSAIYRGESAELQAILHVYQNMTSRFAGTFARTHFPVTLLGFIIETIAEADGEIAAAFDYEGITHAHFAAAGVLGMDAGNFADAVARFETLLAAPGMALPGDIAGLRTLADAAIVCLALEDGGFLAGLPPYRTRIEAAIQLLAPNGTPKEIAWPYDHQQHDPGHVAVVTIGGAEIELILAAPALPPTVTGVTVNPATATVARGATHTFTVTVTGVAEPTLDVNWSVEGYEHVQTRIDATGTLTVPFSEAAATLTVRATSTFDGDIYGTATVTLTGDIALDVPGADLNAQLTWIRANAGGNDGIYLVELAPGNQLITATQSSLTTIPVERRPITIIISGEGPGETQVRLNSSGSLFHIPTGITLVLEDNVTLVGRGGIGSHTTAMTSSTNSLVVVADGGTFRMNAGSRLIGNRNIQADTNLGAGGGVWVISGGVFVLDGGEISGNSATSTATAATAAGHGGGVRVQSGGRFDMLAGTISRNEGEFGGGVRVKAGGTFRMGGGVIYGNDAPAELANVSRGLGAALSNIGTAQTGIFDAAGGFTVYQNLGIVATTIRVVPLTGTVTLSPTAPIVGQRITATHVGNGTGAATWVWYRENTVIPGATGATRYVVVDDDFQRLRARVSFADQIGWVQSEQTSIVRMASLVGTVTLSTTTPTVGQRITATHDGNGTGVATWTWYRGNTLIYISTANNFRYVLPGDEGQTLRVRLSFADQTGSIQSGVTSPVTRARLVGTVTLDNYTPQFRNLITADFDGNATGVITWQWLRGDTEIPGATGNTHRVVPADHGHALRVRVTSGHQYGYVISAPTAPIVVPPSWTVNFTPASGPAIPAQEVFDGERATMPSHPAMPFNFTSAGLFPRTGAQNTIVWYHGGTPFSFVTPITGDITLVAQARPPAPVIPAATDAAYIGRVVAHVNANPGNWVLVLDSDINTPAGHTIGAGVNLEIRTDLTGTQRTIQLTGTGRMFTVSGNPSTLVLRGIQLRGVTNNNNNLVFISGANTNMVMSSNTAIVENINTGGTGFGGGVGVNAGGRLIMFGTDANPALIGFNEARNATSGGGVMLTNGGQLIALRGAVIDANQTSGAPGGGGVFIRDASSHVLAVNLRIGSLNNSQGQAASSVWHIASGGQFQRATAPVGFTFTDWNPATLPTLTTVGTYTTANRSTVVNVVNGQWP